MSLFQPSHPIHVILPMSNTEHFDIVFTGTGLSGLSTAIALLDQPELEHLSIALVDRDDKSKNDRTWCFWARPDELRRMPPVIFRSWPRFQFHSPVHSEQLQTRGYTYNMVRGLDFYTWAKQTLAKYPNVVWINDTVQSVEETSGTVHLSGRSITGTWILNSALTPFSVVPNYHKDDFVPPFSTNTTNPPAQTVHLLQHFKGWIIRTPKPVFEPDSVTFMDFRVEQGDDTRFVYVLPFSTTEALVEFTLFSPELLSAGAYVEALHDYIRTFLKIDHYDIVEEEFGIIPMSDYAFPNHTEGSRVIHIGTAGGFVKASSGYAFKRTQRRARAFAANWARHGQPDPSVMRSHWRYPAYDAVLLRVLNDKLLPAHQVFGYFFKNQGAYNVFRFLDEDTNFLQDLRAMSAVPVLPFVKGAFRLLWSKLRS